MDSSPRPTPRSPGLRAFDRRLLQVRDVFSMRAHFGWIHFLVHKIEELLGSSPSVTRRLTERLSRQSDRRTAAFDRKHGTDTFSRTWVSCGHDPDSSKIVWGYSPINQDFFREMMRAVPVSHRDYAFVDVGSGKGAALMLASEFGFRRYLGVEISAPLLETAARNMDQYRASTRRSFAPELILTDFMKWPIPPEDTLFFMNNPFPPDLSLRALLRIEESILERPRRVLLVYRKAPGNVGEHLHASSAWVPLRLAPYWRIYASLSLAGDLSGPRARPGAGRS
jgi:hypothetical protein